MARVKVRGPLFGVWRIALYYVVLLTVAFFLARFFPVFEEVVFGGLEDLIARAQGEASRSFGESFVQETGPVPPNWAATPDRIQARSSRWSPPYPFWAPFPS
jgi:hypothetical protein